MNRDAEIRIWVKQVIGDEVGELIKNLRDDDWLAESDNMIKSDRDYTVAYEELERWYDFLRS